MREYHAGGRRRPVLLLRPLKAPTTTSGQHVRAFNGVLRRIGLTPRRTGRYPNGNGLKAAGWRLLRKVGIGA